MTAREYLRQYEEAERLVQQHKTEYEEEIMKIDTIRSSVGDGTPHGGTISNTAEDKALRLVEKAEKLKRAEEDAVRIRQEVYDVIQRVPGDEGTVLYERYIHLKKWEDIADAMHYSTSNIFKIHRKALRITAEYIEV